MSIRRLLIANRGEIARRITRTAHQMGIEVVAIFADDDANSPFVREADRALTLGSGPLSETYLNSTAIIERALTSRADAIHPGYGFLSEQADFARAVIGAGLTWVGPPPEAIAALGDKLAAKRIVSAVGVPVLPSIEVASDTELEFPLLIKAAAGGGGKAMHIVNTPDELHAALAVAQREALHAFADTTLFVERYLQNARHIEVQVLADDHGNLVHCFERECSIQRRHQRVIEEAPSPSIDGEQRGALTRAALAAVAAAGYRNAGTVEFVVEPSGAFWFLEVNTRLQVEHPVTEEVTGIDLVREQLRIAEGKPISFRQEDLALTGHAIEARLYAEDPAHDYLPSPGHLLEWAPRVDLGARFESGVESGTEIGSDFDPMLAKVIVHADSRTEAAQRLAMVLATTRIRGLTTNRDLLVATLRHRDFLEGQATTSFLSQAELRSRTEDDDLLDAAYALTLCQAERRRSNAPILRSIPSGWTNAVLEPQRVRYLVDGGELEIRYRRDRDGSYLVGHNDQEDIAIIGQDSDGSVTLQRGGRLHRFHIFTSAKESWVQGAGHDHKLVAVDRFGNRSEPVAAGTLASPLPGHVSKVWVQVGDRVRTGQALVTIEAMKMEHTITAPSPGVVTEIYVRANQQVKAAAPLVLLDETGND